MRDFTTMEHLQERVSSYGAVLRYNDRVFVTDTLILTKSNAGCSSLIPRTKHSRTRVTQSLGALGRNEPVKHGSGAERLCCS